MSQIAAIDPANAPSHVKTLLDGVKKGLGMTPNMFRVAAQSPAALEALVGLFGAVAKGSLNARSREAIALAVSELNGCDYCLSAHSALGKQAGLDEHALQQARAAQSDDAQRASLLSFAKAVVTQRGRVGGALQQARQAGVSDQELVEVVANVALTLYTNYLNLVADTEIDFPLVRHNPR